YRIRVLEERPATEGDRQIIAAQTRSLEAEMLRNDWTEASFKRCVEKYQEALTLWREAGSMAGQASTLKSIGEVYCIVANYRDAIKCFEQALDLYRNAHIKEGECDALNCLSSTCIYISENQRALSLAQTALGLSQLNGFRREQGRALNNLGVAYYF